MRSTPGRHHAHLAGAVMPSSRSHPQAQPAQRPGGGDAVHLGEVLLLDPEGGMGEALGQLAVVGEEQQALGVGVEAPDREDAGLVGHEVDHRGPTVGVVAPW